MPAFPDSPAWLQGSTAGRRLLHVHTGIMAAAKMLEEVCDLLGGGR